MTDRGCFALPSTFSQTSKTCSDCSARKECGEKVLATLNLIRSSIKVEHLIAQFHMGDAPIGLSLVQRTMVASMPVAIAGRLEILLLAGFDQSARSRFAIRENPFSTSGAKHIRLTGDLLIAGGFTKMELRQAFQERFGWGKNTAFVEVARTLALLRGLSLITESGGYIALADTTT